ncbi:hypothetical protein PPGU19_085650 (plasmid) [Paraburkholderia sp. PGU19]|nr:hypothetical protein PPGU19_085650 [Paraburkholderia sp. PGU19]
MSFVDASGAGRVSTYKQLRGKPHGFPYRRLDWSQFIIRISARPMGWDSITQLAGMTRSWKQKTMTAALRRIVLIEGTP